MIQPNFKWWVGVVEDRADPERIGRYRVRILGYHTANKIELPTEDLPWASTVMPVTSASMSGISQTPSLVEGTTVVGFFGDGDDEQLPVIMGSMPGIPQTKIEDPAVGFSDPFNNYPRDGEEDGYNELKEPDISRLARGQNAENHASLRKKRDERITAIPTAKASSVISVSDDIPGAEYFGTEWDEPHPRFGTTSSGNYTAPGDVPTFDDGTTSVYPYNNVTETESGHVFETDDTPGNGRIHEYHNAGTFYEIQADGTKVTKIVGDEYEITLKDKKVFINGSCDVTIGGDAKLLVKGDMYQEIDGNLFTTVGKDRVTKIGGNDVTEISSGMNLNVAKEMGVRVGNIYSLDAGGEGIFSFGGAITTTAGADYTVSAVLGKTDFISGLGASVSTAAGNITLSSAAGTFRASGLGMSLISTTAQNIVCGGAQVIASGAAQTISSVGLQTMVAGASQNMAVTGTQTITAPTRVITGATTHTGVYNISGAANVSGLTTSGSVYSSGTIIAGTTSLSTHVHTAVTTGVGVSGPPA